MVAIYWDVNHPPSTGVMIPNPGPLTVCKAVQGWDVNMACSRLVVQHGKQPIEIVKDGETVGF